MQHALLICDMQLDNLAMVGENTLAERIATYARAAQVQYRRIYMGGCWHPPDLEGHFDLGPAPDHVNLFPVHCLADTPGAGWHPTLVAAKDDEVINGYYYKGQFNVPARSMFESVTLSKGYTLDSRLKYFTITDVDVVGIDLDGAVLATALDAAALGYRPRILTDLTERYAALAQAPLTVGPSCERFGIGLTTSVAAWDTPTGDVKAPNVPGDYAAVAAEPNF